ncbi:fatty acid desaturase [Thalassococcus sp. BH17M4-6]|uniref:fatty acid desaturase n=1 Tax=Thalassococcus sp. BH17M4-6 TaxID=3413148 RepID=UPI003BEE6A77
MAATKDGGPQGAAREWVKVLAKYREPNTARSLFELAVTVVPFLGLWALSWWLLDHSYVAAVLVAMLNGGFLVRLFGIQHDCGHGSFLASRRARDWIGRILGVVTVTPYDVWRRAHSIHHATSGDLSQRGLGDVTTLTVAEYREKGPLGRLQYRIYRNPLVMFGIGPVYLFMLRNRLPFGLMNQGRRYWISAMGTNLAIALVLGALAYFGGWQPLVLIFLPSTLTAASIGVWLFYVQHQFEDTHWDGAEDWQVHEAALHGSSHYDLPLVLRWITANIGIHHVHHLYSRIPFYRLPQVLRDHSELVDCSRMTLRDSLKCARLHLWCEEHRKLVTFATARRGALA